MTIRNVSKVALRNLRRSVNPPKLSDQRFEIPQLKGGNWSRNAINIRYVDAGGGQDCANELVAAFGPDYDLEQYGIRIVASPRHADLLFVTGCVTTKMADPLRRTYESIPNPKVVVACGDAAITGGPFVRAKHCLGPVSGTIPVDLSIPGDPPSAASLIEFFSKISGRTSR
ncbi:MAG: oxidoreductase [Actinomycetota bacterium]|nr:oxidoreductase [Actinomycetota bacterium]